VQRQSPLAALLTICLTMAWRLLIFRRPPFSAIMTASLSASMNRVDRFLAPLGRPFGTPDELTGAARNLADGLGIPVFIRDGRIYQHGPGVEFLPPKDDRPTPSFDEEFFTEAGEEE